MTLIEENGSLWVFNPSASTWSLISPDTASPYLAAHIYHCLTSDGDDKIYAHSIYLEEGRLSNLWSFQISGRKWTQLTSKPEPPRGGTSIAIAGVYYIG